MSTPSWLPTHPRYDNAPPTGTVRVPWKCILSRRQRAVSRVPSLHLQYFPRRLPHSRLHHPQLQLPRQMSQLSRPFPPSPPALSLCLQSLRHGSRPKYRDRYGHLSPTKTLPLLLRSALTRQLGRFWTATSAVGTRRELSFLVRLTFCVVSLQQLSGNMGMRS